MANVDSDSSLEGSFSKTFKNLKSREILSISTNSNNRSLNDSHTSMDSLVDLSNDFDFSLKISVMNKASRASGEFRKVTIGPNADQENQNLRVYVTTSPRIVTYHGTPVNEKKTDRSSPHFSMSKIQLETENYRKENVKKSIEQKKQEMDMALETLKKNKDKQLQYLSEERKRSNAKKLACLQKIEEDKAQQDERCRRHEREKRKEKENKEISKIISSHRDSFHAKWRDITALSKSCLNKERSTEILFSYTPKLKELNTDMESINAKSSNNDLESADIKRAENLSNCMNDIYKQFKREVEMLNATHQEEIAKRNLEEAQADLARKEQLLREKLIERHQQTARNDTILQQPQEPQLEVVDVIDSKNEPVVVSNPVQQEQSSTVLAVPLVPATSQPSNVEASKETVKKESSPYPDPESVHLYIESRQFLEKFSTELQEFVQSPATKELKFGCQKAISVPINTISKMTGSQLAEKYESLKLLLLGKSKPNILTHPRGGDFCKNSIAMKFLEQGENNIAIKPETAFSFAAVIVTLWNDFPDFGKLFISQLWAKSPFFVPVFFSLKEGQPIETYYRLLGCKFNEDGTHEESDKFLKRLSGLMYLYASIIVTRQRKGCDKPHPHGLANGWRWLTATINIEPKLDTVDICATLICNFLEVTGNDMFKTFPKQFPKLLQVLKNDYFPKLKNASPTGSGPLSRLEDFLTNAVTNSIPPPKGQLPPGYW